MHVTVPRKTIWVDITQEIPDLKNEFSDSGNPIFNTFQVTTLNLQFPRSTRASAGREEFGPNNFQNQFNVPSDYVKINFRLF